MRKKLLLSTMLLLAWVGMARAQENVLTVYDGTVTNSNVPLEGYWADAYQKCEFVIPADQLSAMKDKFITMMSFYLSSPASESWGDAQFMVFLKEVNDKTISTYLGTTGSTTVYEGALDGTQSMMDIDFTTPYKYKGGNLLVGIYQTVKGQYASAKFYGKAIESTSVQGHSQNSLDEVATAQFNFIPKTTFSYSANSSICIKPTDLSVTDIVTWDAKVTWTSDADKWDLRYRRIGDTEWNLVEGIINKYYTFDGWLDVATQYEVQVRTNCGGGSTSNWASTTFTTAICDEESQETISYELTDSYGDGWNGNAIQIVHSSSGIVAATLDMTKDDGKMKKGTLNLCRAEYDFVWVKGKYGDECGFTIKDNFGDEILSHKTGKAPEEGVLTSCEITWFNPAGKRPTNLAIAEGPGPDRVTLTWTPGSEDQTTWEFSYMKEGDMTEYGVDQIHVTSPCKYEFKGLYDALEPNTTYRVKIRSSQYDSGGMSRWSNIVTFTTTGENPIPFQVNVETTHNKATISWVGYSYWYDVKYREKGDSRWIVTRVLGDGQALNTYSLTNLTPDTEYEYQIIGIAYPNEANEGTEVETFKTEAFSAPKNLTISDITPNAATVSWTSTASSVELQYAKVPDDVNVGSGWHYYDNGEFATAVGTGTGSTFSWGIMIPAGTYSGSVLKTVSVYDCAEMEGTITVYSEDDTQSDVVGSKGITLTGAKKYVDFNMDNIPIDPSKDLWVIIKNESGANYPAACSLDETNDCNGRWVGLSGDWMDLASAGISGRTFMVRAEIGGIIDPSLLTWTTVSDNATSPRTLANLSNDTQYAVRVQAKEGRSYESDWVTTYFKTFPDNPVPFNLTAEPAENTATLSWNGFSTSYGLRYRTTEQEVKTFFDDFENGMDKWTIIRNGEGTENTDWHQDDLTTSFYGMYSAHSGANVAVTRSWSNQIAYNVDNWLITPKVTLDGTLRFWVMDEGAYHEHYDVYVSTTTNDISAFTLLSSPGNASGLWKEVTVDLRSFHGQKGYIALRNQDYDQDFLLLDDFGIYGIGVPAGDWTTFNVSANSIVLVGLNPSTDYEFQVRGKKGSNTSEWSPAAMFTTLNASSGITTDIENSQSDSVKGQSDDWYTIDGQKMNGKPTKKGVYIHNGKKIAF